MWIILWEIYAPNVRWPTRQEWLNRRGKWPEMPNVVGMIDGTSHEILIPSTKPQQDFYSVHRKYHCIHTQVVICATTNTVYITISVIEQTVNRQMRSSGKECQINQLQGFLGHDNDANAYHRIGPIGPGDALDFPPQCYILADSIYPNGYPLVTPFKSVEIIRQTRAEKRFRRKFNILHRNRRVYVEHVIKEIKTFKVIGSLFRHPRWKLSSIVELCAGLAKRRADLSGELA
ncbi:unnamed protein product [Mytilus coruscus]|uniref:DDE Tnp4 domain-containing protein n=1 Tax=Mytilus coruscus TaxID=42192 RepID=A0A6J8EEC2_MYTCO|nr:unnamed protein product [Mytilus coruscus]